MKRLILSILFFAITTIVNAQTFYSNKVDVLYWDYAYEKWNLKYTENSLSEFVFSKGKSYFVHQTSEMTAFYEVLETTDYLDDGTPMFRVKSSADNFYYLVMTSDYFAFTWNDKNGNLVMASWFIYFSKE